MAKQPREVRLLPPPETWLKILISEVEVLYLFTTSHLSVHVIKRVVSFGINSSFICMTVKLLLRNDPRHFLFNLEKCLLVLFSDVNVSYLVYEYRDCSIIDPSIKSLVMVL